MQNILSDFSIRPLFVTSSVTESFTLLFLVLW